MIDATLLNRVATACSHNAGTRTECLDCAIAREEAEHAAAVRECALRESRLRAMKALRANREGA